MIFFLFDEENYQEAKLDINSETGTWPTSKLLSRNTFAQFNKIGRFAKT